MFCVTQPIIRPVFHSAVMAAWPWLGMASSTPLSVLISQERRRVSLLER